MQLKKTITFLFGCYCNSDFHCTCATIDDPVSYIEMVDVVSSISIKIIENEILKGQLHN